MKSVHAVVTGASAGIGAGIARELGVAGARLTLVARRREPMEEIIAETCADGIVFARDLADPAQRLDWLDEAEQKNGPVEILVNNAGVQIVEATATTDLDAAERLLAVNLLAPLALTRNLLPGMLERGRGTIVDIASMAALAPTPRMTWYNASKGGIAAASEALRGELRGTGIHVVTVYPGIIPTDMGEAGMQAYRSTALLRMQPQGTTQELARRIRRAIEQRHDRVIYPSANTLARWLPPMTRWLMDRVTPDLAERKQK